MEKEEEKKSDVAKKRHEFDAADPRDEEPFGDDGEDSDNDGDKKE